MKIKRVLSICFATVILACSFSLTASADDGYAIENMYARINGGATVSSASATKGSTRDSMFYQATAASANGWSDSGDEWVYFRGRSASGSVQVTELAHRNYYGSLQTGYMTYLSGYGSLGSKYKIAIQYDSTNPYQYVNLRVGWAP